VSGFDQAPAQQGLPIVAPAVTPGMLCSSVVSFCIFTCIYLCWGMMVNGFSGKFHEPLYESIFVPLSLFLMMAGLPILVGGSNLVKFSIIVSFLRLSCLFLAFHRKWVGLELNIYICHLLLRTTFVALKALLILMMFLLYKYIY
jgi:hypothetical protein